MSIFDEMIADSNEYAEQAKCLAGLLAQGRFLFDSKPEHLTEAIFRIRTYLSRVSFEDPDRRIVMKQLADLKQTRFEDFGVRSGREGGSPCRFQTRQIHGLISKHLIP